MSRRRGEPVKNTCPDIDRILATIKSIFNEMESCSDEDDKETLLESISNWKTDLYSIGVGKSNELEDLRSANAALRDWGNEMYNDAESLEIERDRLEDKIEELNSEISSLKRINN